MCFPDIPGKSPFALVATTIPAIALRDRVLNFLAQTRDGTISRAKSLLLWRDDVQIALF